VCLCLRLCVCVSIHTIEPKLLKLQSPNLHKRYSDSPSWMRWKSLCHTNLQSKLACNKRRESHRHFRFCGNLPNGKLNITSKANSQGHLDLKTVAHNSLQLDNAMRSSNFVVLFIIRSANYDKFSFLTCVILQSYCARYWYRLDVCLSVCPSVTRWYCVETAQLIVKLSSLPGSPIILIFWGPNFYPEFQWEQPQRGRGVKCNG